MLPEFSRTTRRRFLTASATAGAIGFAPYTSAHAFDAATELAEGAAGGDPAAIRPFHFTASDAALADLKRRVEMTRWPESRDRHRRHPGRATRDHPGARALLGRRLRLAPVRGAAERAAELHHRDRRARHPLPARALEARERRAADRHARLARLDPRAAEDHRPTDRSHRARRRRRRRLPPGYPLAARARLLRQADGGGLGSGPHRACLGRR